MIDDFRSGDFKNLAGYRGDFVAQNLATLDWQKQFGDEKFDAIFHLASITDTTNARSVRTGARQRGKFSASLEFRAADTNADHLCLVGMRPTGPATRGERGIKRRCARERLRIFESDHGQYRQSRRCGESPDWIIIGLRYFNVYGPREAHKGVPASMVYHLAQQIKAGQRPRIFKHGEQKRDFVYVKDIVARKHSARSEAKQERNLQSRLRSGALVQ